MTTTIVGVKRSINDKENKSENVVINIDDGEEESDVEFVAELGPTSKQRKRNTNNDAKRKNVRNTSDQVTNKSATKSSSDEDQGENDFNWSYISSLSSAFHLPSSTCQRLCSLMDEGNSVPFIARYRQEQRQQLDPKIIRAFEDKYDELKKVRDKVRRLENSAQRQSKPLSNRMLRKMYEAQSMEDLEAIEAYLRVPRTSKLTVITKDIEVKAEQVLKGSTEVKMETKGSSGEDQDVVGSVVNVLVDLLSKSEATLAFLLDIEKRVQWILHSTKVNKRKATNTTTKSKKGVEEHKYENYYDFSAKLEALKPHQILAINRGVKLKVLSSKLEPRGGRWLQRSFQNFCYDTYYERQQGVKSSSNTYNDEELERSRVFQMAVDASYDKHVLPFLQRKKRSDLSRLAEDASIDVFCSNLRRMLLKRPQRDTCVLAIDPGYRCGCKLAVLSASGRVMFTGVIYPTFKQPRPISERDLALLIDLVRKHNIDVFALGDGVGSRDMERLLSFFDKIDAFSPKRLKYTIVSEVGASVYSCSTEAQSEFPRLKPSDIGAISIGRRLQDPLIELIKIDPKTLGVGMYQHDLSDSKITKALKSVVIDCVSFVGVDLNKANASVLTHVAGLGPKMASAIVEYRESHGAFKSRETLLKIKGIGKMTFRQCAGFVRIFGSDCRFDALPIHPEDYETARRVMNYLKVKESEIGEERVRRMCGQVAKDDTALRTMAEKFSVEQTNVSLIVHALAQELHSDLRDCDMSNVVLFKESVMSACDLTTGELVTGLVENVTHFGAFVNIGVEFSGLVHNSKMMGMKVELGQRVRVKVYDLDMQRRRIGLQLISIINQ